MSADQPAPMLSDGKKAIQIVPYQPAYRQRFKEINEQWIRARFELEEEDVRVLSDPENYILKNGGFIFIALYDGYPVGTCGYQNFGNGVYEMIKMAVDENYRGLGIGRKIGEASLREMKELGARKIFLLSNTRGAAVAIELYRKLGFRETELGETEFIRADIRMELAF